MIAELAGRAIGTSVHFIPVHQLTYFGRVASIPPGGMTGADALFDQLLSLPIHPRLTDTQIDAVCAALADITHRRFSRKGSE